MYVYVFIEKKLVEENEYFEWNIILVKYKIFVFITAF